MSRSKELAKSIGSTLTSQATTAVVSLAFFAYFGRMLEKSEMALFALVGTLSAWLLLLSGLGIGTLAIRETPTLVAEGKHEDVRRLISSAIVYRAILSVVVAIGILLLIPWLSRAVFESDRYTASLRLVTVVAWLMAQGQTLALIQWALQCFHIRALCNVVNAVGARVLALVGYLWLGIDGFVLGFGAAAVLIVVIHLWTLRRELTAHLMPLGRLLRQSSSYIGADLLRNLMRSVDRPLVGVLLGDVALADFYVAKRIYEFIAAALIAVTSPIGAKISEVKIQGRAALNAYFHKGLFLLAILFVPVGCVMVSLTEPILRVLTGTKYLSASSILACFGITIMAQSTFQVWYEGLFRLARPRYLVLHNVLQAVVTFSLYGVLLPFLGPKGIPLSYAAACVAAGGFSAYLLHRQVGLTGRLDVYARSGLCGAGVFVATWAAAQLGHSVWALAVIGCAAAASYATGFVLLVPPDVRPLLRRISQRVPGLRRVPL
ncbi:MAG: oligosaccharide flippase family protein [bacterium]|nr:oligosaccharide flippase family protein [bacterium]